ncbi:MAG: nucleic acid-binding protein [Planctomycetaceae bacterium]|nr:nucleic acid-binding protein [Planctomycetaceae bacterium]
MILLDSDHFTVVVDSRHRLHASLISRLLAVDETIALPIIVVEEQMRAWMAQINRIRDSYQLVVPYGHLVQLIDVLADWEIIPWSDKSATEFDNLRAGRVLIGTQDLRIASIARATESILLSANSRDFDKVPGLQVEDWLHR